MYRVSIESTLSSGLVEKVGFYARLGPGAAHERLACHAGLSLRGVWVQHLLLQQVAYI